MQLMCTPLLVDYVRPRDSPGCFGEGSGKLVGIVTSKMYLIFTDKKN